MTDDVFQPGIVPMTSYDSRKTHDDAHSPAYKALAKSPEGRPVTKVHIRTAGVCQQDRSRCLPSVARCGEGQGGGRFKVRRQPR